MEKDGIQISKITLSEALELVDVSKSKLYQHAAEGIITTDGHSPSSNGTRPPPSESVQVLKLQVSMLET